MGMTLDVAVATHGKEGICRVEKMLLPPQERVRYVVSWQEHGNAPIPETLAKRSDVDVWRLEIKGVSNNRNNATDHCSADIVLVSDDDLIYEPDAFHRIITAFEKMPELDLATFRVKFHKSKPYPSDGTVLRLPFPKNYWVSCVEIAFRRKRLSEVRFNPGIGPGAPVLMCGEDELFVIDAIKSGLDCRHIAELICSHPYPSTGTRVNDGILRSSGFIIRTIYPLTYIPRIFLKAYRTTKGSNHKILHAVRMMLEGSHIHLD